MLALFFILAVVVADVVHAGDDVQLRQLQACQTRVLLSGPDRFDLLALGGDSSCATGRFGPQCCEPLESLFGKDGYISECMCNKEFFSSIVMGLPARHGVQPQQYTDMLMRCGIPIVGQSQCPGFTRSEEPVPLVQKQDGSGVAFLGRLLRDQVGETSDNGAASSGLVGQSSNTEEETTGSGPSASIDTDTDLQDTIEVSGTTYISKPIGQTNPPTAAAVAAAPNSGYAQGGEQSGGDNTVTSEGESESKPSDSMQQSAVPLARSAPSVGGTAQGKPAEDTSPTSGENEGDSTEAEENSEPVSGSRHTRSSHTSEKIIDVTLDFVPVISGCTDVVEVASEIPNLTTLVKMMKAAGVVESVAGQNKVMTILAPTNGAFGATLKAIGITLDQLLANPALIKRILALHIIPGQALKSTDVSDGQKFKTLSGEEVTFSVMADIDVMSVTVPSGVNSEVILKNLEACSAVVHVIGTMLLPDVKKGLQTTETSEGNNNRGDGTGGQQGEQGRNQEESSRSLEAVTAQSQESAEGR